MFDADDDEMIMIIMLFTETMGMMLRKDDNTYVLAQINVTDKA